MNNENNIILYQDDNEITRVQYDLQMKICG